jgi:AAHS family 4-hydroxybenzoate transporter-like MFS transporter
MSEASTEINVTELIDRRPLGAYQLVIIAICIFVALMDGFDSQAAGAAGPMIMAAFHLQPAQLGAVFSGPSWGFLFGALIGGPCADRWGRKPSLVVSVILFAVCTIATPLVSDFQSLVAVRTLTGIGLGAAAPCFVSIATEYVPRRIRARLVTVLWAALPGGGMIVGFLGPFVLPSLGWHAIFYIGGALSLLAAILVIFALPESVVFAVTRGDKATRVKSLLTPLTSQAIDAGRATFVVSEQRTTGAPVKHLFSDRRAPTTLLLWVAFFADYFALIALVVWTPTLLKQAGMPIGQASAALAFNNIGGVVGCLIAGYLIERLGPYRILILTFAAACAAIALTGHFAPAFIPVAALETLGGLFIGGGGAGLIAFAALLYPTHMRSTGIGWGLGIGRLGGATGPLVAGALVGAAWTPPAVFLAIGCAALPAAVAIAVLRLCAAKSPLLAAKPRPSVSA